VENLSISEMTMEIWWDSFARIAIIPEEMPDETIEKTGRGITRRLSR
jgi:hypothetical protein